VWLQCSAAPLAQLLWSEAFHATLILAQLIVSSPIGSKLRNAMFPAAVGSCQKLRPWLLPPRMAVPCAMCKLRVRLSAMHSPVQLIASGMHGRRGHIAALHVGLARQTAPEINTRMLCMAVWCVLAQRAKSEIVRLVHALCIASSAIGLIGLFAMRSVARVSMSEAGMKR